MMISLKSIVFIIMLSPFAEGRSIYTRKQEPETATPIIVKNKIEAIKHDYKIQIKKQINKGNLPNYSLISKNVNYKISDVTVVEDNGTYHLSKVKIGDEYRVVLSNMIYAIEGIQIKIAGRILNGPVMGAAVSGYTELEPYSKSIIVKFSKLTLDTGESFEIDSNLGTELNYSLKPDKYISKKSTFMSSYILSAFASAYLQSKVRFTQNIWGLNTENNTKNAAYMGASKGLEKISGDISDALDNAKDVAYISNNTEFKLSILSRPKLL